jgi:uncharacterized membrane protein YjgN (DUF898 family)
MTENAPMEPESPRVETREATVAFTGSRGELLGVLVRGYLTMPFTLGLYRFWMLTRMRRFYWSHTEIDSDPLEYTGTAIQLLIGFMIAVLIFLPLYLFFFYLSFQRPEVALYGYAGVTVGLYFLAGYAIYRARRFRLTRTLWRGIRLHQSGNAWFYALRRFGWTVLVIITGGLVYPFMVSNLWRYRSNNTWYGDRQFRIEASWKTVAGPFYIAYFLNLGMLIAIVVLAGMNNGIAAVLLGIVWAFLAVWGLYFYRSRETSRMFSALRLGDAALSVSVRGRALLGQMVAFLLSLVGTVIAFGVIFGLLVFAMMGQVISPEMLEDGGALADFAALGAINLVVLGVTYFAFLGSLAALAELILGYGYWLLVARRAVISDADSLTSVRALGDESPVVGEGLADALNVGAY